MGRLLGFEEVREEQVDPRKEFYSQLENSFILFTLLKNSLNILEPIITGHL
jgi:hypothetical protein